MPVKKALFRGGMAASAVVAVVAVAVWMQYPFANTRPVQVEVKTGDNLRSVLSRLPRKSVIHHPLLLSRFAGLAGDPDRIAAGEYLLQPGESLSGFLRMLASGEVVMYSVTFPEGWTFRQILRKLHEQPNVRPTLKGLGDDEVMRTLGRPGEHPEGRFFPDTYRYQKGTTDQAILRRAYRQQAVHLHREWANRSPGLALNSPYQALILASIIEREGALDSERPKISGVYQRRLEQGMLLQADATVIYGMGETFDGNLTRADLRRDTRYNSYVRSGLPPTPIANPGLSSLRAALHPDSGAALFYVAKGDGSHHFSTTLEEHNRAVAQYQLGE